MKIVQAVNHFSPCIGGVEKVVEGLSKGLHKKGHEVKVLCLNKCANSRHCLPKNGKELGVKVERMPFIDLKYYKVCFGLLNGIKNVAIVHVHGIGFMSDLLLLTKFIHKKTVIVSTHGGIFHTQKLGLLKKFYFNIIQRFLLGQADEIIAVSKNDYELFSKICKKVSFVGNGIDTSEFKPGKKIKNSFIFVGRFSENKRVELLFDVFKKVAEKNGGDFSFIVCGNDWGKLADGYRKKVKELGLTKKVRFVIEPSELELKKLYSEAEFFVSASRYEGFGLSLVEAMASGCIPIVQPNEGFSAILRKNEFYAEFEKTEDAAEKIVQKIKLGQKEKKDISKKAIEMAKGFSVEKNTMETEKIYLENYKSK